MKRALLINIAATIVMMSLVAPLFAKDGGKKTEVELPEVADASLRWESGITGAWETSTPGLDWVWANPALESEFRGKALLPWSPDPSSGVVLKLEGKGRWNVKDPQGARSFLALTRVRGEAWLGLQLRGTLGEGFLVANWGIGSEGGLRIESLLDADASFEPVGAEPEAFWTRLGPQVAFLGEWGLRVPGLRVESSFRAEVGREAEDAYGRTFAPQVRAEVDGKALWKFWDLGKTEFRVGGSGQYQWSAGLFGPQIEHEGAALFRVEGKAFTLGVVPWRLTDAREGWTVEFEGRAEDRGLAIEMRGPWAGQSALQLGIFVREEY